MIEPGEEPGPWFGRVKLLFLPACYLLFSIVARAYKFGAIALSPRAVLETTATALLLAAVVFPLLRCGGRLGRGAMAAVFALVFGVNLAGMLLAGTLGVPAGIRLIPLTPDLVFIRTTMQDGAVSGSLLKAAAMWLGSSIVVGAAWWRIARHVRAPRPAASGLALAGGAALAAVSVLLPVAARAGDRDTWVALLQSVAGGTSVQAPPRPDKLEFAETSLLGAPPGGDPTLPAEPPRLVVVIVWETGVSSALGWPDRIPAEMPNLRALAAESIVSPQHMSTAPQSTKSIFSIVTGLYPQPSAQVETHLRPDARWPSMGAAFARGGYQTGVLTSFPGRYDRLDEFFHANGFETVEDRDSLGLSNLPSLPLGSDEELYSHAEEWLKNRGRALLLLIPSNSHHPFWYPGADGGGGRPERYVRAMQYQDLLLGRFIDSLRASGNWEQTALILCADHGNYFGLVSESEPPPISSYHVPLLIRMPGVPARRLNGVSSHVDLLPTLLQACGLQPMETQGTSLLAPLPGRVVFQSECIDALRVSCTDGRVILTINPESSGELLTPWRPGADEAIVTTMRERLALFHRFQYWHIQDLLDGGN